MQTIARYFNVKRIDNYSTALAAVSARRAAKILQKVVAKRMGIPASRLCNLERGRFDWSEHLIVRYEKAISPKTGANKR